MLEGAKKDYLTNCFSRDVLQTFLEKTISESKSKGGTFSLLLIDLDNFKKFNDKFGHLFGDEILKYVASTMRLTLRNKGYIFRYGGDEFIVAFLNTPRKEIVRLSRRCNINIANRPFLYQGKLYKITISCGIAAFPDNGDRLGSLLSKADTAMYLSKHYGGNLTTEVSRITYIKARNVIIIIVSSVVLFSSAFLLNRYIFKEFVQRAVKKVSAIKIVTKPIRRPLDIIVLRNGSAFKGRIIKETNEFVVVNLELAGGDAIITLSRREIAGITYAPKQEKTNP